MWIVVIGMVYSFVVMKHRAWLISPSVGQHRRRGHARLRLRPGTHRYNRNSLVAVVDLVGAGRIR